MAKFIFGGGEGLPMYYFAIAVGLLAAAFQSEQALGIFLAGWSLVIFGTWLLFDGRQSDPTIFVDVANTVLTMLTADGTIVLSPHTRMLLHATFHISICTLSAMLMGPKNWFGATVPLLYTIAAFFMLFADRSVRQLDPSLEDLTLKMSIEAIDYLATPWAWLVYNLLGGSKRAIAWPFVAFIAYKSVLAMYECPMEMVPAAYELVTSPRLAAASPYARFLFGAVPMWNLIVLYPIVVPRIIIAVKHGRSIIGL